MIKKYVFRLIKNISICILFLLTFNNECFGATKSVGISSFPASYQVYLKELKKLHSNWTYTALNTGIDWDDAVKNEGPSINLKRSAIQISFSDIWKWKNSMR